MSCGEACLNGQMKKRKEGRKEGKKGSKEQFENVRINKGM